MIWFNILLLAILFAISFPVCAISGYVAVQRFCIALGLEPKKYSRAAVRSYGFVYLLMFCGSAYAAFSPDNLMANMLMGGFATAAGLIALILLGLAGVFCSLEQEAKKLKQKQTASPEQSN